MNYTETSTYTHKGIEVEYHYSPTVTISEQIAFVKLVTDSVFVDGSYIPLLKQPVFNYTLISLFTDINVDVYSHIDDFDTFDKETNVTADLIEQISPTIYKNLVESVDANIEYQKNITHDTVSTAIVDLVNVAKDKIKNFGNDLDSNMVMDFIKKFSDSDISSESIVNAYLSSNEYKNNVADLIDSKNAQIRDLKKKVNDYTASNVVADKTKGKVVKEVK